MTVSPEAKLMTTWVVGNVADTLITHIGVLSGQFVEKMPINRILLSEGNFDAQMIQKMGLTLLFAGFYALATKYPKGERLNYKYIGDKVLIAGNFIIWGGVILNVAQVLLNHFSR